MHLLILGAALAEHKQIFVDLESDPLCAMELWRQSFGSADKGYQETLYRMLAGVYGFALKAKLDRRLMDDFLNLPGWPSRSKRRKPENILRLAIQYFMNAGDQGPVYNRACAHERALKAFFAAEVPATEIYGRIMMGGGLEQLGRPQAQAAAILVKSTTENLLLEDDGEDEASMQPSGADPSGDEVDPVSSTLPMSNSRASGKKEKLVTEKARRKKKPPEPSHYDPDRHLLLEVSPLQMQAALTHPSGTGLIRVIYSAVHNNWRDITMLELVEK